MNCELPLNIVGPPTELRSQQPDSASACLRSYEERLITNTTNWYATTQYSSTVVQSVMLVGFNKILVVLNYN
jgi:hypothetical protein